MLIGRYRMSFRGEESAGRHVLFPLSTMPFPPHPPTPTSLYLNLTYRLSSNSTSSKSFLAIVIGSFFVSHLMSAL